MSDPKTKRKVVAITGDLAARVSELSKKNDISDREALELIAKGEQTEIVEYFPTAFTKMIKKDLDSVDRNERVLAYQEISDAANAARSAQELTNSIEKMKLIKTTVDLQLAKIGTEAERKITEKSKQDYYRSRDIDSQDRKEIRNIAIEERKRLAEEKERGA